jgi:hypothetical protein
MFPGSVKKAACWAGCLVFFTGMSAGRYDWSPTLRDFAVRGYALHLFFAALFFPSLHYILADLDIRRAWRQIGCAFLGVIYAFPHHWLGTDRYYLFRQGPTCWDWRDAGMPLPEPDWFWGALHRLPDIPYEALFFLLLLGAGSFVLIVWRKAHPFAVTAPWGRILPFMVLALILFQTWLHLSLRSPYTYIPHYEQPPESHYWYHNYLFAGAQGAVNFDYHIFRSAELVFLGDAHPWDVLPGRFFPMFISNPWSAFINPYYVWITLNVIAWSLACIAIYYLALNEFGPRCAFFSTLFMSSAQGIMVYVAQPMIYVFAISGVAILLALQQRLFEPKRFQPMGALVFGAICALFLLTYESQPWLIGLAFIAFLRGFNLRWTMLSLVLAFFLYECSKILITRLPQLVLVNPSFMDKDPWDNIKEMILGLHTTRLWRHSWSALNGFRIVMTHAFNFCLVPAFFGLFLIRSSSRRYLALLSIGVPALLTYCFFDMGSSFYIQFPRLVYQAYPLIYILGGLCLAKLSEYPRSPRWPRIGLCAAIAAIFLFFAWVNADVFGHPFIYYYWFYRGQGFA